MRPTSLRRLSDVLADTLISLNHRRCRRNILPSTQIKLIHFSDQYYRPGPCCDIITTSHWYVNKTYQIETSQRCTNWHISETDQLNTLQKRFNWYLNEADNVLASALVIIFDIWSLMFYRFIKNENGSEHLY